MSRVIDRQFPPFPRTLNARGLDFWEATMSADIEIGGRQT